MADQAADAEHAASCAFCGRSSAEGLRLHMSGHNPLVAICEPCLFRMERWARRRGDDEPDLPHASPQPLDDSADSQPGGRAPFSRRLLRVIPIGRSYREGSCELTVIALEVYAESCVMTGWLRAVALSADERALQPLAWVTLSLSDDLGARYSTEQLASATSIDSGYFHGRLNYEFRPTLNPAARTLQVMVSELRWEHWERSAPDDEAALYRHWGEEGTPWGFTIDLAPPTGSRAVRPVAEDA